MELIIRRAVLAHHVEGRDAPVDIGIDSGRIVAVEPHLAATARRRETRHTSQRAPASTTT